MDGMLELATNPLGGPARTGFLGILYAEDFDDPQPPAAEPEPPAPALAQSDLDEACAQAVAQARLQWETDATEQRLSLLGAVRSALAHAGTEAEKVALAAADATVATILAILMGAVPKLCEQHGPCEVRAVLDRLLPTLRTEPKVTIRVHADLVADLRQELADLEADFAGVVTVTAAPLARGDVKVAWENGSLVRDTQHIHRAMHDALIQLGLLAPFETAPKRSLAHAE